MEQRGLRVLETNTTFFSKITTSITKMLIPTKVGLNNILINIKRNNVIKAYESYRNLDEVEAIEKKENITHKYEEAYALYLEAIDKYIMDSVYTKVKNNNASDFEKTALSKYYEVTRLKENEYLEYKYRKQKYLLELDYETVKNIKKTRDRFIKLYINKMDGLYKAILKNYSVQLSDNIHKNSQYKNQLYEKIFKTLGDYISNVLPIKIELEPTSYDTILKDYEEYEKFSVGKQNKKDEIEKNMILLGLSRPLFTHSLPLIAAEQCYNYLLKETREAIINSYTEGKKGAVYELLINLIEEYNIRILSTKIYWSKPEEKEEYKNFWSKYKEAKDSRDKEILFMKHDIVKLRGSKKDYSKIIKFYKEKLVAYGVMRNMKNTGKTLAGRYTKNV